MVHWTLHLKGGPKRVNHAAVALDGHIFSFGGYCTGESFKTKKPIDVSIFDTSKCTWYILPLPWDDWYDGKNNVPYKRYGHSVVLYNRRMYLWGGRNDNATCSTLFCFDPLTLKWSTPEVKGKLPGGRDGHSACVIGDCMYIFGGFQEDINQFCNNVYVLNFKTMAWSLLYTKGKPPRARDFHSATAIGHKMYVFGGRCDLGVSNSEQDEYYCRKIRYLDTKTLTWHKSPATGYKPCGRRSHSAFLMNGKLYVFGGYNGCSKKHYNDTYEFNPDTNEWHIFNIGGCCPIKRRRQACVTIDKKVFIFGGTSPDPSFNCVSLEDEDSDSEMDEKLQDHADMHVLDFDPSLYTLCILRVLEHGMDMSNLPMCIRNDIHNMVPRNTDCLKVVNKPRNDVCAAQNIVMEVGDFLRDEDSAHEESSTDDFDSFAENHL